MEVEILKRASAHFQYCLRPEAEAKASQLLEGLKDRPEHKLLALNKVDLADAELGEPQALLVRERTGKGQFVDIGMLDSVASLLTYQAGIYFATGATPGRMGNRHPTIVPYETFEASDGDFVVAVGNDEQWRRFCGVIGREALGIELFAEQEGNGISGYVAATGRSYICPDVERDPRYVMGLDQAKSSLTVPLRLHDKVIGIFNVESRQRAAFNEDDRQFAEIKKLHETYAPSCEEHCRLIQEAAQARDALHHVVAVLGAHGVQGAHDVLPQHREQGDGHAVEDREQHHEAGPPRDPRVRHHA